MSKEQLVMDAQAALLIAQGDVLGQLVDKAQAEVVPVPEPDVQAQIDAAVAAKGAADQVKLDALQAELDAAIAADANDKAMLAVKQEMLDKIKALLG